MKKYPAALLLLCALVGMPGRASAQINIVSGPKDTTNNGYFVIKFRVAFDPVNRVYLQAWDDPAVGHIQGQFLDTQGNRIGGPFALGAGGTGWVNVTFGGPADKPRFLVTYLWGNGTTNPKLARLVQYANGGPVFGPEVYITDVNGEWSDADIAGAVWTGSQFVVSWRWQGASYLRGIDIDGNYTTGLQSLGDGLDVEVNPTLACGGGVCLAHGFAFGMAFGAVGGSWARFFDPQSLAPIGPVFYVDNHAGIMEDQRVAYNQRIGQFQMAWVRLKSRVDFRLVAPNGQVGPLDVAQSLPGGQIALTYNPGSQTSLLTMNGADIRVTAVELNDSGYPMRDGIGNPQSLPVSLSWQGEGSPPLYYSMPAANPTDAQWLVVYSAFTNGRAGIVQKTANSGGGGDSGISRPAGPPVMRLNGDTFSDVFAYKPADGSWGGSISQAGGGFATIGGYWLQGFTTLAADFNGDALTDIFLSHPTTGQWFKMINTGGAFSVQESGVWGLVQKFVIDLNGDGISDLFLYEPATGVWYKAISTPNGFMYYRSYWGPGWEITPMNLNGDAFGDMFLYERSTGRYAWVLGQDGGGFSYPLNGYWGPGWNLYPGDFNGDGLSDLLLHDQATGRYFVARNTGIAGYDFSYTGSAWTLGWTPYAADLNGDGADDLFLFNATSGMWYELISNRQGQFGDGGYGFWGPGWEIHPMDFNADKRTDILLYNPATGEWYQAWNVGTGAFSYVNGNWGTGLTILTGSPRR